MEIALNVRKFSELDVKMTNFPYWNQFKTPEWVMSAIATASENSGEFKITESLVAPALAYLQAKDKKRQERMLNTLYKSIAKNLSKLSTLEVIYDPKDQHKIKCGDLALSILEDCCFVFLNRRPVLQVKMRLVTMWAHLLPYMLKIC